jgi:hypothetical protein
MVVKPFNDFTGGLNLTQSTQIEDNQLTIAKNVFYNNAKQLQTRRGYTTFWDQIGSAPITSYFFFQRDDTLERIAVCNSWTSAYEFDGTNWNSIQSNLMEFETIPWTTSNRTRWDYAVYKNVIYMDDWVNPYASYDWTTYTQIGLGTATTCTFDNTTEYVNKTTHWLDTNDEVFFVETSGTLPAEITEYQVYYVTKIDNDNFTISTTIGGTALDFTDDWTGTLDFRKLSEPRVRYVQYLWDRIYWAGDDANPSSLYYTWAAPADWTDINANVVIVWGDEQGRINGLNEFSQLVVTFKDTKVYAVDVVSPSVDAIDSQTGWYSDRTIHNVGNSMAYFNERGIDTLIKRSGVDWSSAIESKPLSDNVRDLIEDIEEIQYNASAAKYIKKLNNYYFSFDTTNDNKPDTTLVYNSLTKWRSQYFLPALYDYGLYINTDNEHQHLFASASGWQMYQFEYWFDDNGQPIEVEIQTKEFDFNDPAQVKTFNFIDVTGYKQEAWDIDIKVIVDWDVEAEGTVTDTNIDITSPSGILWVSAIGSDPIGSGWTDTEGLPLYKFTVRVPMYSRGANIAINLSSTWVQRIVEKMRVDVNGEVVPVFNYSDIL